ncbi:unnamed protein product [Durusdinium trenchii]|uniref:VWFA domain-containing protein n=1 Tax=Durusdinium trenchii TaxID=1381693 RepID=A0ABP0QSC3_9DINO
MSVSFLSRDFLQVGVQEMLRIEEVLQAVQLRVSLERSSKSVSVGLLEYHHAGTLDCPKPRPGCHRCGQFAGCPAGQTPRCAGGVDAPTCSSEPALPEKQDWFELRLGGAAKASYVGNTTDACGDWPLGPPVKIGMALSLTSGGPDDAMAQVIVSTLEQLLRWVNRVRGGLCMGETRRAVELLVLDTQGKVELFPSAMQRLAYDHNVSLFLAPDGLENMADAQLCILMAAR